MKIFVDKDVILDIFLNRKDFTYSAEVLKHIERGKLRGFTSPVIFVNIFYLISKEKNKKEAWETLRKLRLLFKATKINQAVVDRALASNIKDFEDAIQYYSALNSKAEYLVTRNKSDYLTGELRVVSPQELLAIIDKN